MHSILGIYTDGGSQDLTMLSVFGNEPVNESRDFIGATCASQAGRTTMQELRENRSFLKQAVAREPIRNIQSVGKLSLFTEDLGQPKAGLGPVGCQFGTALKSASGKPSVSVCQECATGTEKECWLVHWAEIA
jgi:hypothetical protein